MLMTRRLHDRSAKTFASALLFFMLAGTTSASAQMTSPPTQETQPSVGNGNVGQGAEQSAPSESPPRSRIEGWFNRSGSGLFIALTPFATGVALFILLLVILLPFLFRAGSRRAKRGYFKTVSYSRQRRVA